jgi:hypothetical protein
VSDEDPVALAAQLGIVAEKLERSGYSAAGVVHRAARFLVAHADVLQPNDDDVCPVCGAVVVQPERGRPRIYCSPRCQRTKKR